MRSLVWKSGEKRELERFLGVEGYSYLLSMIFSVKKSYNYLQTNLVVCSFGF